MLSRGLIIVASDDELPQVIQAARAPRRLADLLHSRQQDCH
jgi:hypothetical protein